MQIDNQIASHRWRSRRTNSQCGRPLVADFIPEIFLWVEFGRVGWKIREHDAGKDDKVAAAVVGRAVENQQDILPGTLAPRCRHDQIVPSLGET